jgi:hypothetical protein
MSANPLARAPIDPRFAVLWLVPLAIAAAVCFAPQVLGDGDTFWHLAAGRWMIAHGAVPATDPFSFTFAGRPWMAHEWLSEVFMAAAWLAAGWSGVMLLTGLAAGALTALMAAWLLRWLSPLCALLALALGLACVGPGLLARPHFLALPVLALWTLGLMQAREQCRPPSLWLALLLALWANLHSSFIVGLIVAAAFALEAALDFKTWTRRSLVGWAAFLALSVVATLATPHGIEGLAFPLKVLNMKTLPVITEWQGPDFMKVTSLEIAILGGLFFAFWKGAKLTAVRAAILLGLAHMSLQHVRQEVLLGVVGPLILAEPLGRALGRTDPAPLGWRAPPVQAALGAALLAAILLARLLAPMTRVDGPTAPVTALARTPAALRATPVLNDYNFGGYLIFEGVRPYIDGRADMYGDLFVADDDAIQRGAQPAIARAIARYHIRWAILRPDRPLVGSLEHMPGWKRLYADKYAVVLANTVPTPSSPPPVSAPRSSAGG